MADFYIKKGDLLPKIAATLTDAAGVAINLTGATVLFRMRAATPAAIKVSAAATILVAASGTVEYPWAGTDTDTAGLYNAEWVVTFGANKETVPNDSHLAVQVTETLA